MAELPTQEQLKQLYEQKGHAALVWYAWRNALRALPLLGNLALNNVWPVDTVQHIYALCRVHIILAQWLGDPSKVKLADAAAAKAAKAAYAATGIAAADVAAAYAAADVAAAYAKAADVAAAAYADAAYVAAAAKVGGPKDAAYAYAKAAYADAAYADAKAANYDYAWLLSHKQLEHEQCISQALWSMGKSATQPKDWQQCCQALSQQLTALGLDFLAQDLNALWEGKPLGAHALNYLNDYSETITNNPEKLRRAILYGENTERIQAVRVILLGSGGSGKSSLADRLQNKPVQMVKPATPGVDYLNYQPLKLAEHFPDVAKAANELELYLWDFGGQSIFHGLHSAFLHENCVYVLVVDSRHEQAPDEWLQQIRHLVGNNAQVLLVTNIYEHCHTQQNERRLLREFPELLKPEHFFYFSCIEEQSAVLQDFIQALVKACLDSRRSVFKTTMDAQRQIQQRFEKQIFVRKRELIELINEQHLEDTLQQLQQLGFLVQVEKGGIQYCLKPSWTVDYAYQLLYAPELRKVNGVLALENLSQLFADKVDEDEIEYLLRFLQQRSLCTALDREGLYFFPDAAPANEPERVKVLLASPHCLCLHFDLPYLPLGLHAQLVSHLFNTCIQDKQAIWRQGFILSYKQSQALIAYQFRKASIECTLSGELSDFTKLLNSFYQALQRVVISKQGIKAEQIQPFVTDNYKNLFSVHNGEQLIDVFKTIETYEDLFREVKTMAGKGDTYNINHSQFIKGDHNIQKQHADNVTISITADQRKIVGSVLDELLTHKTTLDADVLEAIFDARKVVKKDAEKPTEKTQSFLEQFYAKMKSLAGFTDDVSKIGTFVSDNLPAVTTAVTAALPYIHQALT